MRRLSIVALFMAFCGMHVNGQSFLIDSTRSFLPPVKNILHLGVEHLPFTYRWIGDANVSHGAAGSLQLFVEQQFHSSLFRLDDHATERLEESAILNAIVPIYSQFSLLGRTTAFIVTDDRLVGLSNATSLTAMGGGKYEETSPEIKKISMEGLTGWKADKQQGIHSNGPIVRGIAGIEKMNIDNFFIDAHAGYQGEFLSAGDVMRKNDDIDIHAITTKEFSREASVAFDASYIKSMRDFVSSVQTAPDIFSYNRERRIERRIATGGGLFYRLSNAMRFEGKISADARAVTRENSLPKEKTSDKTIDEFGIETNGLLHIDHLFSDRSWWDINGMYVERSQLFALTLKDNNQTRRLALRTAVFAPLSGSDDLDVGVSGTLVRFDRPSRGNNDDRDELYIATNVRLHHVIGKKDFLEIELMYTASHLVYLFEEQSANNAWRRIPRLAMAVVSNRDNVKNLFHAEVSANYTTYDFQDIVPGLGLHSTAFRTFFVDDSASFTLANNLWFDLHASFRLIERSDFHWQQFSEQPVSRMREEYYEFFVRNEFVALSLAAGARMIRISSMPASQSTIGAFDDGTEELRLGPALRVLTHLSQRSRVMADVWYQFGTVRSMPADLRQVMPVTILGSITAEWYL